MANFKRLLLVDDSEIDRRILRNILSKRFEITEVGNGYAALELLMNKKSGIDGMLLDISMPVLDGFDVLRVMTENKIKLPVALVTAEATAENVKFASQFGISDFISKPFDSQTVLDKICRIFGVSKDVPQEKGAEDRVVGSETYATDSYISKLTAIYDTFLKNSGLDPSHCARFKAHGDFAYRIRSCAQAGYRRNRPQDDEQGCVFLQYRSDGNAVALF